MSKYIGLLNAPSRRHQHGQAMVEYAILIILLVTMVVGGMELAKTALASSKNSDAAKAGANELAALYAIYNPLVATQEEYTLKLADAGVTNFTAGDAPECSSASLVGSYANYLLFIQSNESVADLQNCLNTNTSFIGFDLVANGGDGDGIVEESEIRNQVGSIAKYKAMIIMSQINIENLGDFGLADHDPSTNNGMAMASCGADNTYDYGLPDRYLDGGTKVYLFHPLPIDLASCTGNDTTRGNRSKISILVNGYGNKPDDANYEQGLPKLNQAMYGLYSKVCLDAGNQYVSCTKPYDKMWLKPPGKLCLTHTSSDTVDSCSTDTPPLSTSGYYFWGKSNQSTAQFKYDITDTPKFRPTFQVSCDDDDPFSPDITGTACAGDPKTVRIQTRYRAVFEGFLAFGAQELEQASLAHYFFDPSGLRGLGTGSLGVAIPGSELGVKSSTGQPTVKPFRDFRGCYEVDIATAQVSACN